MSSERFKATSLALVAMVSVVVVLPLAAPAGAEELIVNQRSIHSGNNELIVRFRSESEAPDTSEPETTTPVLPSTTPATATDLATRGSTTSTTAAPPAGPASDQLPATGSKTWWIVGAGLGLAGAGLALVRSSVLTVKQR